MYIKEIKLNGFKSFADKTSIELNNNFTGIVGPNGSGKSNIVDAIKWVLGEQSVKSLRGSSSMSDVIFAGALLREKAQRASVSLIFDNSDKSINIDYNEVSIKRCVYRSGENEYYLNNEKCRLKDITSLFIDSFNSRDTFNIIAQGKIDEIISSNPYDRRIIFEEASGVLKYKVRKEDALRKLDKTHENIERVDIILGELSSNIEPLEKQACVAKEYKDIREKLDYYDISLIVKDITYNNNILKEKTIRKEECENILSTFNSFSVKENVLIQKAKNKLISLEEKLKSTTLSIKSSNDILASLNKKVILLKERSKYDNTTSTIQKNINSLKEKELIVKNKCSLLQKDISINNSLYKNLQGKIDDLSKEYNTDLQKKQIFDNDLYNSIKKKFEITSLIDNISSSIERENMLPYAVKSIIGNRSLCGIESTIGQAVSCIDEYLLAIDTALGASSSFIITRNEEDAKNAINYLKNDNKGRATFFPLTVIKPKSIDPRDEEVIKNMKGFISLASECVTYDKKYYNIIKNTLGNIIIADNISNAATISKSVFHKYRVVTLDGNIIHVGGSLTGGSFKSNNSLLTEKYELIRQENILKEIMLKINDQEKITEELEFNNETIKEKIYKTNIELISVKELLNIKNKELEAYSCEYKDLVDEIKTLTSSDKSLVNEEEKTLNEYYKNEQQKELLIKDETIITKEISSIKDDINDRESNLKLKGSKYNSLTNELKEIDVLIFKTNYTQDSLLSRLNEDYNLTYEKAITMYEINDELENKREEVVNLKRRLKSLGDVNISSIEEFDRVSVRYNYLNTQKEDLLLSEKDLLKIIDELDEIMSKRFESTFNQINKEFNNVFKSLFGGGEAYLKFTNPDDILSTGILVQAIPKGKTLKSISLLSGGEKALTAVSLLFAIMNLKKVPFVILDEVESALDEANVDKFGSYLEHYRDKTQLLIITHKKKTMEYVDTLYGVTMQESGVSKLVSVNLEDDKEEKK
ncbi:MAG: AAA family ATPase [Bacilli bacterium]